MPPVAALSTNIVSCKSRETWHNNRCVNRNEKETNALFSNILLVASQVGMLFLMMAVGFLLTKLGKIAENGRVQMSFILLNVVTPCLIVDTLQVDRTPELVKSIGLGALLLCMIYAAWFLLSALCFRRQPADTRASLQFGLVYSNSGFMGLPLVEAMLGSQGLLYATTPYVLFNIFAWTHGAALMGGRKSLSLRKIILNPGILASIVALGLFFLNIRLPDTIGTAVHYLGSMNTPLAMLVIGAQMAQADLGATFRSPRLYLASLLRLLVFPMVVVLLLLPMKLDPVMYVTYAILAATPAAGMTAIFAQQFRRDTVSAARLVTLSTLLSIITLPCMAVLARTLNPY